MANDVAPEFVRFILDERQENRIPVPKDPLKEGDRSSPILLAGPRATEFLRIAARRAVGLFRPTEQSQVIWMHGDSELAVSLAGMDLKYTEGLILILIPVLCDQTGEALIEIAFAVGTENQPAGLFASTFRRPNGPPLIVEAWGETLVAFAWQCLLGMMSGIAGAVGKDDRGNNLVPVELTASEEGIKILPMARYRFSRSPAGNTTTTRGIL